MEERFIGVSFECVTGIRYRTCMPSLLCLFPRCADASKIMYCSATIFNAFTHSLTRLCCYCYFYHIRCNPWALTSHLTTNCTAA